MPLQKEGKLWCSKILPVPLSWYKSLTPGCIVRPSACSSTALPSKSPVRTVCQQSPIGMQDLESRYATTFSATSRPRKLWADGPYKRMCRTSRRNGDEGTTTSPALGSLLAPKLVTRQSWQESLLTKRISRLPPCHAQKEHLKKDCPQRPKRLANKRQNVDASSLLFVMVIRLALLVLPLHRQLHRPLHHLPLKNEPA